MIYHCRIHNVTETTERAMRGHVEAAHAPELKLPAKYNGRAAKPRGLESNGRAALEEAPPAPKKNEKILVTLWYESEGGEVLKTTLGPMTAYWASALISDACHGLVRAAETEGDTTKVCWDREPNRWIESETIKERNARLRAADEACLLARAVVWPAEVKS